MSYKITEKSLEEKLKKRLEKKFKLKSVEKYDLRTADSSVYPYEDKCESKQIIWFNDAEFMQINYINTQIWENAREEAEKNKDKMDYMFQEMEDEEKCIIEMVFKKEHILFATQILIIYLDACISDEIYYPARINNQVLKIRQANPKYDKEKDSLGGCFVMIDEDAFVDTIEDNISDEMKIEIIIRDWDSFYVISEYSFRFEYYKYDEYYLMEKEWKRTDEIKNKNKSR